MPNSLESVVVCEGSRTYFDCYCEGLAVLGNYESNANKVNTGAFKIQAHAMFLDTSFNSLATVLTNIYESFVETATKMWTYIKCLPAQKRPGTKLVISRSLRHVISPD
jgi:hypothetical protein